MNRMWCGNHDRHPAHGWGVWSQHFCAGKRNPRNGFGGKPS